MKKEYFYRKADDIIDLEKKLLIYREYLTELNYTISKKIFLKNEDFEDFIMNFKVTRGFIEDNIKLMKMDDFDNVSCLLVFCSSYSYGILVYSAGYSYPRYVAKHYLNK